MGSVLEKTISKILASEKSMTIATIRDDGYPQATTTSYVNDGLEIHFGCDAKSRDARDITRRNNSIAWIGSCAPSSLRSQNTRQNQRLDTLKAISVLDYSLGFGHTDLVIL